MARSRKQHGDDVETDLGVIREIAEVGADRCSEVCRSELADQSSERRQSRLSSASLPICSICRRRSRSRTSLRGPVASMAQGLLVVFRVFNLPRPSLRDTTKRDAALSKHFLQFRSNISRFSFTQNCSLIRARRGNWPNQIASRAIVSKEAHPLENRVETMPRVDWPSFFNDEC